MTGDSMTEDRMHQLAAEAFESARKWGNLAILHRSRGEDREAQYADQAQSGARRYAEIMSERANAPKVSE